MSNVCTSLQYYMQFEVRFNGVHVKVMRSIRAILRRKFIYETKYSPEKWMSDKSKVNLEMSSNRFLLPSLKSAAFFCFLITSKVSGLEVREDQGLEVKPGLYLAYCPG